MEDHASLGPWKYDRYRRGYFCYALQMESVISMETSAILFYALAALIVFSSAAVVLVANPIYSALFLVMAMVGLAFIFFMMNALFIGGVQLIVYAGAVMVLFVMVLMLFDLKKEDVAFSKGRFTGFLKITFSGLLLGLIMWSVGGSMEMLLSGPIYSGAQLGAVQTGELAQVLFTKYLFAFEALGLLLLLVAVGAVAVSRIKGGTHGPS